MKTQTEVCKKFSVLPYLCDSKEKLGIALDTISEAPINGLRHTPENGTCGWYIWCGEKMPKNIDAFKPLHVCHIAEYLPEVVPYLSLPPGYRFLIDGAYEDV